ncbi:MAG TPA: hypothetical protein VHG08_05790 [Longimicrobium sp.]|nr:hypothetical protein [Longimicrobium sp.]
MTSIVARAMVVVLICAVLMDPYGWYWYGSYDVAWWVWWKPAIGVLDLVLLALVGHAAATRRWRRAAWLSAAECAFAIVAGLFIAHADLVRNARWIAWLPGLRVLLAAYVATLVLRLVLALMLYRAANPGGARRGTA